MRETPSQTSTLSSFQSFFNIGLLDHTSKGRRPEMEDGFVFVDQVCVGEEDLTLTKKGLKRSSERKTLVVRKQSHLLASSYRCVATGKIGPSFHFTCGLVALNVACDIRTATVLTFIRHSDIILKERGHLYHVLILFPSEDLPSH